MLKNIVNKLIHFNSRTSSNIIKTILINFTSFPYKTAIKLPIIIYGPCKIAKISGEINFLSTPYRGILKIGISDPVRSYHSKSYISIEGKLSIGKRVVLRRGINISIESMGEVILNDDVYIGDNNTIISQDRIEFGSATRVGNNSTFMDTDFHYVINTQTGVVKPMHAPIDIGINNWIGGWCIIKKGTKTPKGTIIAGPYSMLSKNYVDKIPEFSIIAGSPAKLLVEGMRRINNANSDLTISNYYKEEKDNIFIYNKDLEKFCMPQKV